jgi:Cu-processing system ATP-binding protein
MIAINALKKRFGKNQVLENLNLEITGGGIFAILGPNGSGKTTLIKSVLGMVLPNSGEIRIDDEKIERQAAYRKDIQYMPQIANFPGNLSVRELLHMIMDLRGGGSNELPLIQSFGLEPFLRKKLSTLSGGTKQKVNIVLAFMFDAPLVILDEPTTGLDPSALIKLKELINEEKARGKAILITSHIMQFVEEMADEVVYLLEGRIYFKGTVKELNRRTGQTDFEHAIAAIANTQADA